MELIRPSKNISREEIEKRLKFMKGESNNILDTSRKSKEMAKVALNQFRELKRFAKNEYHILTLSRNRDIVSNSSALRDYEACFTHMHFTSGKIGLDKLSWNLDEFDEGIRYYNTFCDGNKI